MSSDTTGNLTTEDTEITEEFNCRDNGDRRQFKIWEIGIWILLGIWSLEFGNFRSEEG